MGVDLTAKTVVCIASGPSLTPGDCNLVERSGHPAIAVNSSWEIAPFAAILYAGDDCWWDQFHDAITIPAERWTCANRAAVKYKIRLHKIRGPYHSGLRAMQLAAELGARRIVMLGYDCQYSNGRHHWHDDYRGLGNAHSHHKWPAQHAFWKSQIGNASEVLNASRETAITCWPRVSIEEALAELPAEASA